ncbi:ABC transporter ATP-binding protein [Aquibacillus rhizosphaerae]|uniref:ATP-binding cassette domain-containing protein n=1 Tax=Aquibacillus rhizosphaerae TaxID=3051431 RepID=A0ABT7L8V4_9BACI|nr:ATP-binding cassette domain-containing protein [Aquibacillus sp. LR5S19]MDL4842288.1 ATP-binding cassette domain-containing protein [Aquibacillus sp. LR5S19]
MFIIKSLNYKDILQIRNVEIHTGKVTTLFGESGSGKSTLLKLLNRLISPDQGTLLYENKPIGEFDPVLLRREVVMLSQAPAIFEGSVRDNLLIGLKFSEKESVTDNKLLKILKEMKLKKGLDDEADKLSGGEKQRIALARVLLMEAKAYLIDEPTSALDEDTEKRVMDYFIEHSKAKSKTIVMVTHSREIAQRYSDQILDMKNINQKRSLSV